MNLARLASAIRDRIRADTGTGGLFNVTTGILRNSDVLYGTGQVERVFPYVTFDVEATQADGFGHDHMLVTVTLHIVDDRNNGIGNCATIIDRVYGDAVTQPSDVPSFGLHRHPLTLTSETNYPDWKVGGVMYRRSSATRHDAECYVFEEVYEFHMSADAATPPP